MKDFPLTLVVRNVPVRPHLRIVHAAFWDSWSSRASIGRDFRLISLPGRHGAILAVLTYSVDRRQPSSGLMQGD